MSLEEAHIIAEIQYPDSTVSFGARAGNNGECHFGILAFKQGNHYGLLDPISMDSSGDLTLKWWVGHEGVTDFFDAPP